MAIGGDDPFTEVTRMEASHDSAASNFCVSQPVDAGFVFHRLWSAVASASGRTTHTCTCARRTANSPATSRRSGSTCQPAPPTCARPGSPAGPDSCCVRARTFAHPGSPAAASPGDFSSGTDHRISGPRTDRAAGPTQSRTPAGTSGSCVTCSSADPNTGAVSPAARSAPFPAAAAVPSQPALPVAQPVAAADSLSRIWCWHARLWHQCLRHACLRHALSPSHDFLSGGQRTVLSGRHRHRSRSTADSHSRTAGDY